MKQPPLPVLYRQLLMILKWSSLLCPFCIVSYWWYWSEAASFTCFVSSATDDTEVKQPPLPVLYRQLLMILKWSSLLYLFCIVSYWWYGSEAASFTCFVSSATDDTEVKQPPLPVLYHQLLMILKWSSLLYLFCIISYWWYWSEAASFARFVSSATTAVVWTVESNSKLNVYVRITSVLLMVLSEWILISHVLIAQSLWMQTQECSLIWTWTHVYDIQSTDVLIVLQYEWVRLNVIRWMNGKLFGSCIGQIIMESNLFTWYLSVATVQTIPQKLMGTLVRRHQFPNSVSWELWFKTEEKNNSSSVSYA